MIKIEIPGWRELRLDVLVLDYNGTLAVDGNLLDGIKEKLNSLSKDLTIHIITADTFGSSVQQCHDVNCTIHLIDNSLTGNHKKKI